MARTRRPDNGDDGDSNGELYYNQLLVAERAANAGPGGAIWISDVIKRIISRDHFERYILPHAKMPPTQRAAPSKRNSQAPPFRLKIDSYNE